MTLFDVIVVGGGLSGGLTARRCAEAGRKVLLIEKQAFVGGEKTWSFHTTDVTPAELQWLSPFVVKSWNTQEVVFPARRRTLPTGYHAIPSSRFREVLKNTPRLEILPECEVVGCDWQTVTFASGSKMQACQVWDARNTTPRGHRAFGYQKFVGQDIRLAQPHGLLHPVIMDATVEQIDGFRFVYLLPWDAHTLLVEDTRYSESPHIDVEGFRGSIRSYLSDRFGDTGETLREERGCLPVPLQAAAESAPNAIGVGAGLYHPTTSYSLPFAVRTADWIAAHSKVPASDLPERWRAFRLKQKDQEMFYVLLNRMLFAAPPARRYRILERFYGLPLPLIERFYSARSSWRDKARLLLWGKPPLPVGQALRGLLRNTLSHA